MLGNKGLRDDIKQEMPCDTMRQRSLTAQWTCERSIYPTFYPYNNTQFSILEKKSRKGRQTVNNELITQT